MSGTADPQVADQVLRYISNARWFAGKGRRVQFRSLTPLPWLTEVSDFFRPAAAPGVRFEIAELAYPPEEDPEPLVASASQPAEEDLEPTQESAAGEPPEMVEPSVTPPTEYYHLAISYRPAPHADLHQAEIARFTDPDLGPVIAYDAAQDPDACRVILSALRGGRRLRSPDSEARFNSTSAAAFSADLQPRLFTGQQSNTSVMLGDTAILKLFRRLELGHNLDIEVHAALNAACISDVAGLFGWIEGSWVSRGLQLDADLAMVIEKLAGAVDGWELALDSLRAENASTTINSEFAFAAEAQALGKALAEIHHALRSSFDTTRVLGARTAMIMMDRLHEGPDCPGARATRRRSAALLRRAGCPDLGYPEGARRLPSGPDAAHSVRLEDHRLRGRAGQDNGRAPGPRLGVARCRRDAAFLRLRRREHSGTAERSLGGRVPCCLLARLHGCGVGRDRSEPAPGVRGRQGDL